MTLFAEHSIWIIETPGKSWLTRAKQRLFASISATRFNKSDSVAVLLRHTVKVICKYWSIKNSFAALRKLDGWIVQLIKGRASLEDIEGLKTSAGLKNQTFRFGYLSSKIEKKERWIVKSTSGSGDINRRHWYAYIILQLIVPGPGLIINLLGFFYFNFFAPASNGQE